MKVILMNDVKPLGTPVRSSTSPTATRATICCRRGSPREASGGAIALLEQQRRAKSRREAEAQADAESLAALLESKQILVSAKSGGNGRLFGTVTNAHVAEAISADLGVAIDRHKIELPDEHQVVGLVPGRSQARQEHHRQNDGQSRRSAN